MAKVVAHAEAREGTQGGGDAAAASLASRPWLPCSSTRAQAL